MKIDISRCLFFVFAASLSIAAFLWGHPFIHDNKEAVTIIVTVFSVLAGFLVGLMALTADPSKLAARGSWKFLELNRPAVRQRLTRQLWMFELYLVTLALIFLSTLCKEMDELLVWIERTYMAFTVLSFLLSFRLPWTLARMQMDHYDEALEQLRKEAGLPPR